MAANGTVAVVVPESAVVEPPAFSPSDGTCLFTGLEGYSFSRFHISADGYEGDVYPADMLETFLPEEEPF